MCLLHGGGPLDGSSDETRSDRGSTEVTGQILGKFVKATTWACAFALGLGAGGAASAKAFDLRIVVGQENEDLAETLQNASLLVELQSRENVAVQDIIASARADYERIVTALYGEARYAPVVEIKIDGREASSLSPFYSPKSVENVEIRVRYGPLFRFGRADIAPVAPGSELPEEFATGEPARVGILQDTVDAGITGWRAVGHAKAELGGQSVTARHAQQQIDAGIRLAPGPQLKFGRLLVSGNEAVRTERIHDIAGFPSGHVFSPEKLKLVSTRLRRTGAFRVVALNEAENIGPDNTLDVTAQLVESPPRRFGFGAEVSSVDGLGLSGYWLHRNLLGGAERLRIDGEISGIGGETGGTDYTVSLRFDRPATFNEDTDFYIESEAERLNEESYTTKSFELGAGITRYASEKREYSFGLGYRFADVTDAFGPRRYALLMAPASATFDYRDDPLNAKDGYYAKAELTPFYALRGTDSGLLGTLDMRAYKTVGAAERLTFALRGQLGSLSGPNLARAPSDFLFYSGGGGTVRGQNYQSLGVDLGGGVTVGGRSFLGISAETRYKITDTIAAVGFYDAGYIGRESFPDGTSGNWHAGAGIGLRYNTGLGPLRLDLAVPVSGPGDNSGVEIYIGIGQSF
ncbi:MAG: outer membrane protein assembly factor [Rhodobacteraceae bacterium]|nr:outer membrane protein assembly factor [Paracoccaceae bacterium]